MRAPSPTMNILLAGEPVTLLPERALHWPRARMLLVADVHFGKAATFRALGVPVPSGTTAHNLQRLDALLAAHDVAQLVFLGDFLHARAAHARATLDALHAWRARHPALHVTLVRGNHDRRAGDPPRSLDLQIVEEPWVQGPFALCHVPARVDGLHAIAGHLHPVHRLQWRADSVRLPCFVIGAHGSVLPAFGSFTGGFTVSPADGERVIVTSEDRVFEVPRRAPHPL